MKRLRFSGVVRDAHAWVFWAAAVAAAPAQVWSDEGEQSCRAEVHAVPAAEAAADWPRQEAPMALTAACWVSPGELRRNGQAATLIDVRPAPLRRAAPVAQALQMDLADLAGKRFLQQQQLVLLGTGLDTSALDLACRHLRAQGFDDVVALAGGAEATLRVQEPSVGPPLLQDLSARDWIVGLGQGVEWSVLSSSRGFQAASTARRPVSDAFWLQTEAGMLGRQLDALARRHAPGRYRKAVIVVVDASAEAAQRIALQSHLQATDHWPQDLPVYWLSGGWQAYEAQVGHMQAIEKTASHRLQAPCGRW